MNQYKKGKKKRKEILMSKKGKGGNFSILYEECSLKVLINIILDSHQCRHSKNQYKWTLNVMVMTT